MPEYLAPGVFVEETSFRSKSIEGVSTSTTAFAGPTRRGPVGESPELLTSFADFERIYGGLSDLSFGADRKACPNYLAHAVRAYFNEGGARLYVARAFSRTGNSDGVASVALLTNPNVRLWARSAGQVGNGKITVTEVRSPATKAAMDRADDGTMVRVGQDAAPAVLTGTRLGPKFDLSTATALAFGVKIGEAAMRHYALSFSAAGADVDAEVTAENDLATTVNIKDEDKELVVVVNGVRQKVVLAVADGRTHASIVDEINKELVGGYATLSGSKLIIGADKVGALSSVVVHAHAKLGFAANRGVVVVPSLTTITADDIDAALRGLGASAGLDAEGRLYLATDAAGEDEQIEITADNEGLGLTARAATGEGETVPAYYLKTGGAWHPSDGGSPLDLSSVDPDNGQVNGKSELVTLTVLTVDGDGRETLYEGLGLHPKHRRFIGAVLGLKATRKADDLERLFAVDVDPDTVNAFELRSALVQAGSSATHGLTGGNDGDEPGIAAYENETDDTKLRGALNVIAGIEDVSIVAAPGSTAYKAGKAIALALIASVAKRRAYRIAVLDSEPLTLPSEVKIWRSQFDSDRAALYYPWVVVANPLAGSSAPDQPVEIALPPSGFVCGIYARNDIERAVFKAPANEVVRSAIRFERDVNLAEQEGLNPLGVNCLRFFPGRGYRVWGARTASSDPEWKYVNVRRYFNYLERSIDVGTQWAVFEPNGERLWTNIRDTISSFLYSEWRSGALLGTDPKEAFFVRCDRSTMDQNDLDNGRLVCLIGVAVVKPAEFVIFRIGQKTADARS